MLWLYFHNSQFHFQEIEILLGLNSIKSSHFSPLFTHRWTCCGILDLFSRPSDMPTAEALLALKKLHSISINDRFKGNHSHTIREDTWLPRASCRKLEPESLGLETITEITRSLGDWVSCYPRKRGNLDWKRVIFHPARQTEERNRKRWLGIIERRVGLFWQMLPISLNIHA